MGESSKIRQYLLGGLSAQERTALEDRYVADESTFQELVAGENDLIDSYVRGLLSEAERREFEKNYCTSPRRQARVEFAAALNRTCARKRGATPGAAPRTGWPAILALIASPRLLAWAAGAAVLALAGFSAWLLFENRALRNDLANARLALTRPGPPGPGLPSAAPLSPNRKLERTAKAATPPAEQPAIAILTLTPGLSRSGGSASPALVLSPNAAWVHLQLRTSGDYPLYEADVRTADGLTVSSFERIPAETKQDQKVVVLRIPASELPPGDYIVRLRAVGTDGKSEEVDVYSFRASKPQ